MSQTSTYHVKEDPDSVTQASVNWKVKPKYHLRHQLQKAVFLS